MKLTEASKFLSLVLRHEPEAIGITLDHGGWVAIDTLLKACADAGHEISPSMLETVVRENDKTRFVVRDGLIRANQGHSIEIDLGLEPAVPPEHLFHGTATRFVGAIHLEAY